MYLTFELYLLLIIVYAVSLCNSIYENMLVSLVSEFGLLFFGIQGSRWFVCSFSYKQWNFMPYLVRWEDGKKNAMSSIFYIYFFF